MDRPADGTGLEPGQAARPGGRQDGLAAALITLVVRHAFPLWAALLVLVRDGLILIAGAMLLVRMKVRIDVRWIGKLATLALMFAIPLIAWGNFGLLAHGPARVTGWIFFAL